MSGTYAKKILLIGWDGADWKVINPLLEAGRMPNLERLVNGGVIGNLATLYPDLSPMLWTSIATGMRPFKHGIYGFTEPDPNTGGIRPVTSLSRRVKAVWNILGQVGWRCVVVGWWPSHPVEPINGVMVSNQYQRAVGQIDEPWPIRPGTVHPGRLIPNLADLRWHPQSLTAGHILPFVPRAGEIDQDKDQRLSTIARIICECCSIQDAALAIMHHEPWDFAAVYFDAIDHFSHGFMRYHPPRKEWVPEDDYEIYKEVVAGGYHLHDIILGKLLDEAGDDAAVILVSDHGFHSDDLRPQHIPLEPAGPAIQHRHYGILAMKGPGFKADERIYGASLLDVCPTVLSLFDLPVGADMDGVPLLNAFEAPMDIDSITSWEDVPGEAGTHPKDILIDPVDASEAINQLVALGYMERPPENREKAVAETRRELDYNLARAYTDAGRHLEAISLLEGLSRKWPHEYRFAIHLATCYEVSGRISDAREVIDGLFRRKHEDAAASREALKDFMEKRKGANAEDLSEQDRRELRHLRAKASFNPYAMEYLLGSIHFAEGDETGAIEHLKKAEKANVGQPGLYLKLGEVYLKMKRWDDAEGCFQKALALDPDSAEAHIGLCRCYLPRRLNSEAAEQALRSVGLIFHNPQGHFLLGVALHRLGLLLRAIEALKVAISQNPNFPEAHRRLAYIYSRRLHDLQKAKRHQGLAREAAKRIRVLKKQKGAVVENELSKNKARKGDRGQSMVSDTQSQVRPFPGPVDAGRIITVVSGLPRSGTSMMMQMLSAGGLPVLTDNRREADNDNPRGYFEYEPVRRLRRDASWLPLAAGKAVKVIAQLLPFLRPEHLYRVIFMERDLTEVLNSQNRLLERRNMKGADLSMERLGKVFSGQEAQAKARLAALNVPVLYLGFARCIEEPAGTASAVNAFLAGVLDEQAMAEAVVPGLYRQRGGKR